MSRNSTFSVTPPQTFDELISRLNTLVGQTLGELSYLTKIHLPQNMVSGKGFAGELIEQVLGASAGSKPMPDFPNLGLELKSVPVDSTFKPLESMFICHASLSGITGETFENSPFYQKICRVLLVFVHAERTIPLKERTILGYRFWMPDHTELEILKSDYEELMEYIATGRIGDINAKIGTALQLRPKGPDGHALVTCNGPDGSEIMTRPRGFYLRRAFIEQLIQKFLTKQ